MVLVPLMFLLEWREFSSAPCLAKKNLKVRVLILQKSRASPDMLLFSRGNKKSPAIRHMNKPLFPTTQSIPSYVVGEKVGLRSYQHPPRTCRLCLWDLHWIFNVVYPGKADRSLFVTSNRCIPDKIHWTLMQSRFERLTSYGLQLGFLCGRRSA
jgi:hypothetical protein